MNRILSSALSSLGALCAGSLFLAACSGSGASPSGSASQTEAVSADAVSGPVTACAVGYAHPSVCCESGPSTSTACEATPATPFAACRAGTTTFPDPRSCCPLDGAADCIRPLPTPVPVTIDPWCFICPPGSVHPDGSATGLCCETSSTGITVCHIGGSGAVPPPAAGGSSGASPGATTTAASGTASGGSTVGSIDAGVGIGPSQDAGVCACPATSAVCIAGQPCPPPCSCPPPPPPHCGECPPGWQSPVGDPQLCCREESDGVIECFTRGVPSPVSGPDAGPICDPNGPPPHVGCAWDIKTCAWECPVCDPAGPAPEPSCKWDSTACAWLCATAASGH